MLWEDQIMTNENIKRRNIKDFLKMGWKKFNSIPGVAVLIPLIIICIILSLAKPQFLTIDNIFNVLRQASIYAIMAVGMTFVIIGGGIDLSQGSVLALAAIVVSFVLKNGEGNMYLAMLAGLLTGAGIGFINGAAIAYLRIPPFIVTLGTMNIVRGIALIITDAKTASANYLPFRTIGQEYLLGIPVPIYIFTIIAFIGHFVLSQTSTGRYIYALGSNEEAARLSGVKTVRNKIIIYTLSGLVVACAAIVYLSRLGAAQPTAGSGYELESIAATIIGGTSISGGEGGMLGSVLGAILVAVIRNGLVILGVKTYWQWVVSGAIIILAVSIDVLRLGFSRRGK